MKFIRPVAVTTAMLTACNVPETVAEAPAYASGTTYALDAVVSVADSYNLTFYRSLQAANTGHTPASSAEWWEAMSTGYLAWASTTAYVVGDKCTYEHKLYECLVNNTDAQPDLNTTGTPAKWLDLGYSNRWKMFDSKNGSKTTQATSITLTVEPGIVDSLAFLGLSAASVSVVMTDPTEGVVFNRSLGLVDTSSIVDWYTYFFESGEISDTVVMTDIPPYGDASLAITISAPGETASIGSLVFGAQKYIGEIQHGADIGIIDYSKKDVDSFGNYTIIERAFSNRFSCDLIISNALVDDLRKALTTYRATPVVWVGTDNLLSSLTVYGFYKSFRIVVQYPTHSTCTLEIEGLT